MAVFSVIVEEPMRAVHCLVRRTEAIALHALMSIEAIAALCVPNTCVAGSVRRAELALFGLLRPISEAIAKDRAILCTLEAHLDGMRIGGHGRAPTTADVVGACAAIVICGARCTAMLRVSVHGEERASLIHGLGRRIRVDSQAGLL